MTTFPQKYQALVEKIVINAHKGTPPPKELSEFVEWCESEIWDLIADSWTDSEILLYDLNYIAWSRFDDDILQDEAEEEIKKITNKLRLQFARQFIDANIHSPMCDLEMKSVHHVEVEDGKNRGAILGWLGENQGQGGLNFQFHGVFKDEKEFLKSLRESNYLTGTEFEKITDKKILDSWKKRKVKKKMKIKKTRKKALR